MSYGVFQDDAFTPPERIYGWLDTQLSIARFYGGCKLQGHNYTVALAEEGQPLVREDVLMREAKEKAAQRKAEKAANAAKQLGLLE